MNELQSITKERCVYARLSLSQIESKLYPKNFDQRHSLNEDSIYNKFHKLFYCEEDRHLYSYSVMKSMPLSELSTKTFYSVIWKKDRASFCRPYSGHGRMCIGVNRKGEKIECPHLKECYERRNK